MDGRHNRNHRISRDDLVIVDRVEELARLIALGPLVAEAPRLEAWLHPREQPQLEPVERIDRILVGEIATRTVGLRPRLRNELSELRRDHMQETTKRRRQTDDLGHRLSLSVIFGVNAIYWIGLAIFLVYERLSETCGCG
jgi:hypothetical protein